MAEWGGSFLITPHMTRGYKRSIETENLFVRNRRGRISDIRPRDGHVEEIHFIENPDPDEERALVVAIVCLVESTRVYLCIVSEDMVENDIIVPW